MDHRLQLNNNKQKLEKILATLSKISEKNIMMISNIASSSDLIEIVKTFNQLSSEFFNLLIIFGKQLDVEKTFGFKAYSMLFETALKINTNLPIDRFCMIILEFADMIYEENEDFFIDLKIKDYDFEAGNSYNIIRSDKFKQLWKMLNKEDQRKCKDLTLLLTTYAHAYFFKTIYNSVAK